MWIKATFTGIYFWFLNQIRCQIRSRNHCLRSRRPPSPCRVWRRRSVKPQAPPCGSLGLTTWWTCGTAAPSLHLILHRPPNPPIWWTWWMRSPRIRPLPAPRRPAPILSPSWASTKWWTGCSALVRRMNPPAWLTWRPRTRWPSATSMLCSTRRARSWMTDSCWWPMGRRCSRKGLRSEWFFGFFVCFFVN